MGQYRKLPVVIDAVEWNGTNQEEISAFAADAACFSDVIHSDGVRVVDAQLEILTSEGMLNATIGDWIIRGVAGEFYPCKPEVFRVTYSAV